MRMHAFEFLLVRWGQFIDLIVQGEIVRAKEGFLDQNSLAPVEVLEGKRTVASQHGLSDLEELILVPCWRDRRAWRTAGILGVIRGELRTGRSCSRRRLTRRRQSNARISCIGLTLTSSLTTRVSDGRSIRARSANGDIWWIGSLLVWCLLWLLSMDTIKDGAKWGLNLARLDLFVDTVDGCSKHMLALKICHIYSLKGDAVMHQSSQWGSTQGLHLLKARKLYGG